MSIKELCDTYLYSESSGVKKKAACDYLCARLADIDPGSKFEAKLGTFGKLFQSRALASLLVTPTLYVLQHQGYDALLLRHLQEQRVIGHTAFQVHPDHSLHIFAVQVLFDYRNNGLALHMVEQVLDYARTHDIERMRIGAGNKKAMTAIHRHIGQRADELSVIAEEGNYVRIVR